MSKKKRSITRLMILLIIAGAVGYTFYANSQSNDGVVRAGDQAENFALRDLDDNRFEMAQQEGKGVFVNFWATYCEPCEREMPHIENVYEDYKGDVEMIAINVDESELTVDTFVSRHKLSFPIAIDRRQEVTRAYGIRPLPATLVIDEYGEVQHYYQGEMTEVMVREFFEKVVPEG
ncbi:thiol-disulfide oxidoreductase ResA [Shouchella lehensis]|uniref:Thiol-disulfide oxidoreductase n=1 Tax=Shouchella lehensis G1 TaxID=1246626 RepID=A0A060LWU7_9BACI|nr:thiol-disulfide oxidoreductase ResA [Shouchella lehensis]AIC94662.1 thiol-disulfide oxidoreductase [Shouchella lehensis G1]RQW20522.1 thiol-disulfide oxidoreductase ResA [Bacillus sp. C1-1]